MTNLNTEGCLDKPIFTVVIVNLNGAAFLQSCIDSVIEQRLAAEIVVVDNGSDDLSVRFLETAYPFIRIIKNSTNLGFAGPANQGAEIAKGKYLLFLNNDARLSEGVLERLRLELDVESVGACQPKLITADQSLDSGGSFFTKTGFLYHCSEDDLNKFRVSPDRFSLKGACFAIKREIFIETGGFDSSYFAYFEETDLCWRIFALGYRLTYVDNATVVHDVGRTTTAIFPSAHIDYLSFRNRISTLRKNGSFSLQIRVLPLHFCLCFATALLFLITGKPSNAAGVVRALWWHIRKPRLVDLWIEPPTRRTNLTQLKSQTVVMPRASALRLLKSYLVRW